VRWGEARSLVEVARVGRLGTVSAAGRPHLVPVCFVLLADPGGTGDTAYTAADHKPKRTVHLRRFENVAATGVATLLVDHYAEDWSALWWVRLDCRGRIVTSPAEVERAGRALAGKYEQYGGQPPAGPVLALDVTGWRGWSAAGSAGPAAVPSAGELEGEDG
jgi:PPOX class probable F420-dependent enzyme